MNIINSILEKANTVVDKVINYFFVNRIDQVIISYFKNAVQSIKNAAPVQYVISKANVIVQNFKKLDSKQRFSMILLIVMLLFTLNALLHADTIFTALTAVTSIIAMIMLIVNTLVVSIINMKKYMQILILITMLIVLVAAVSVAFNPYLHFAILLLVAFYFTSLF